MPLVSDYEPLADISDRLVIPSLVFSIITPIIVIARFLSRRLHGNAVGPDDWTIVASMIFAQTVNIQMIICCQWGFGKHTDELPRPVVSKTLELFYYAQILYKINICLTKISILLFYLRVFKVVHWFKYVCWAVAGVVLAFTVASVFASIFQCIPIRYAYDKSIEGSCIDLTKFWYGNAGYNIATDLIIFILPTLVIRKLSMPKRTQIALIGVFGLGIFVCITSILRFTTLDLATVRTDSMWQSIDSSMWTIIESNLAIIVACMPAFRKSLIRFFPFLLSKVRKTTGGSGGGPSGFYSKSKHMQSSDNEAAGHTFVESSRHYPPAQAELYGKERAWSAYDSSDTADDDQSSSQKHQMKVATPVSVTTPTNGDSYSMDFLAENGRKSTTTIV